MNVNKLITVFGLVLVTLSAAGQEARENSFKLNAGGDFASSYIWRGIALGNGAAVQPWGEASFRGFTIGTWGSYELSGGFNEVDIYGKYTHGDFTVTFVDLFFPGFPGLDQNFFNFKNSTTGHCSELGLSFNGTGKFPLSVYGGIIMYGVAIDPDQDHPDQLNRSAYFELKYSGSVMDYSWNAFAGFTTSKSALYGTDGAGLINVGLAAAKTLSISEKVNIPVKVTLAGNPAAEKVFLTLIISL